MSSSSCLFLGVHLQLQVFAAIYYYSNMDVRLTTQVPHTSINLKLRLGNHQIVWSRIPASLEVNPICWHLRGSHALRGARLSPFGPSHNFEG